MEKLEQVREMVGAGFAVRVVAKRLDLPLDEVKGIINSLNLTLNKEVYSDDKIDYIVGLYKDGVSAKTLGIKFNIDKRRIVKWVADAGILRDPNTTKRLHFFDEHIFDQIDTPEKAYWLGFFYADAYNCATHGSVSLRLKSADIDHIKKFCRFISFDTNQIKTRSMFDEKYQKTYESSGIVMYSIHLCDKLTKLGCMQAKSFIVKYPEWLAPELDFHFIRGLFDGDGSIKMTERTKEYSWRLAGTYEILDTICKKFAEQGINIKFNCISETGNNTYEIDTNGNLKIGRICNLLYRNDTIHLDRKYERYQNLKDQNAARHPLLFNKQSFDDPISINLLGKKDATLTSKFFETIPLEERKEMVPLIVNRIIDIGFSYPDDEREIHKDLQKLNALEIDLTNFVLNNHSRVGLSICKYFCHSYYKTRTRSEPNPIETFNDKNAVKRLVETKLGLHGKGLENLNFSYRGLLHSMKKSWICAQTSSFKPAIAKFVCLKYSEPGDTVGDYSAGFGARLLGAQSCGRKYIGTDPLTASELNEMINFLDLKDCSVVQSGSEYYVGEKNSLDLCWSSPPYFDREVYSAELSQAYAKGEHHFYNFYWRKTLENAKFMLKPNKWFGLNVSEKYIKMVQIAEEYFGEIQDKITMQATRKHMYKEEKHEYIYMFKNNKE